MIKPKTREQLSSLLHQSYRAEKLLQGIHKDLDALYDSLRSDGDRFDLDQGGEFNLDETEQLLRLNRHLSRMERDLNSISLETCSALQRRLADPEDLMTDFEVDISSSFILRESDPAWAEDSDNFLATRSTPVPRLEAPFSENVDFGEKGRGPASLDSEAHCYSFRDITDHCYGPDNPQVSLRDCLRLGTVWVDVVIRQQYWLNLDTGEWEKKSLPSENSPPST